VRAADEDCNQIVHQYARIVCCGTLNFSGVKRLPTEDKVNRIGDKGNEDAQD
jgi:hypothetical protein